MQGKKLCVKRSWFAFNYRPISVKQLVCQSRTGSIRKQNGASLSERAVFEAQPLRDVAHKMRGS
jgi:hypothetical protein